MGAAVQFANGFVTIEQAEELRQKESRALFVEQAGEQYEAMVEALIAYRRASQAWTDAKQAVAMATTLPMVDLIASAERDATERMKRPPAQPVSELETRTKLEKARKR